MNITKAGLALGAAGALLTLVGCLGPWVTSDIADVSAGGLDKDGPVVLGLVAVTTGALVRGRGHRWAIAIGLVASALAAVICFADRADVQENGLGLVEVGWGLHLATASTIMLVLACVAFLVRPPVPTASRAA